MRLGWGANEPAFRQLFTSRMMPDANKEQADAFNEHQRWTTSAECAARYLETVSNFDVDDLLGKVRVPTLVMHARNDLMNPFDEGLLDGLSHIGRALRCFAEQQSRLATNRASRLSSAS